ncbi:MAG: oligosaccharide flippase family protein [Microthrixaceae bacterium]
MSTPQPQSAGTRTSAVVTLLTNGSSAVGSLVFGIVAARWFGASLRGQVVAVMYWPTLIAVLAMLGVPTATTYYAAHEHDQAGSIIGTGMAMMALTGALCTVAVALLAPALVGDTSPQVVAAARLFSLSILLTVVVNVAYHPLRVLGHMAAWNGIRLVIDLTPLTALVLLMVVSSRQLVTYAALMLAVQAAVMVVVLATVCRTTRVRVSRSWIRRLLLYGLPTVFASLPALLNFRIDQAFLVRLVSSAELGNYATAVGWSQAVLVVTNVINYLVLPRVARLRGGERLAEYDHLLRFSVLLILLVAVPLTLVSPVVVPFLFGSEFAEAGRLALVLVPAAGLLGLIALSEEVLRADHQLRGPLLSQVTGVIVTVAALFVAVPLAGVWGAAVVSLVAYLLVLGVLGWFLRMIGLPATSPFLVPHRRQWSGLVDMVRAGLRRGVSMVRR